MRRLSLLATCVLVSACGGGGGKASPPDAARSSSAPSRAHAAAPPTSGPTAVADRCAKQAKGDPAEMMLCFASHHVQVPDSIRTCVKGVRDRSAINKCLEAAAR